jgi:hypothetical protein
MSSGGLLSLSRQAPIRRTEAKGVALPGKKSIVPFNLSQLPFRAAFVLH